TIAATSHLTLDGTGTIAGSSEVANAGTLTIQGNKVVQKMTGAGVTALGANTLTIGDAHNLSGTYAGVASGTGGITTDGTGVLTLSGANDYTGATTINALSHLTLDGTGTIAASSGVANAGTLTIGGNKTVQKLTGNGTAVTLGANTLTIGGANNLSGTYAGVIGADAAGGGITTGGTGTITLSGVNLYTGATTINALSHLTLDGTGTIAASSGVANAGTLTIQGDKVVQKMTGAGVTALGANTLTIGDVHNLSGNYTGIASGTGGITTAGTGVLTLSGANDYTGATTINALSRLTLDGTGTIEGSSGVANAGTLTIQGNKTIDSMTGAGVTTLGANTLTIGDATGTSGTYSGVASGTGGITKAGAGTLTLSGANDYTGVTTYTAGTVSANTIGNGGAAGSIGKAAAAAGNQVLNGGTLSYTGNNTTTDRGFTVNAAGSEIDVTTVGQTLTIQTTGIVTNAAADILTIGGAGNTEIKSAISGTGGLAKDDAGTLTLSGVNTFTTGGIALNAGTLKLGSTTALGGATSKLTINGGTIDNSNGAALVMANNNPVDVKSDWTFTGTNDLTFAAGAWTLYGTGTVTLTTAGKNLTVGGIVGDLGNAFGLGTAGAGTLTLDKANTYTGATTIGAGSTLALDATGTIETSSGVANSGTFTTAAAKTIQSLTGAGVTTLGGGDLTVGDANNRSGTYSGAIGDGGGARGVIKAGTGTWTISGVNTYTGATAINAGTLALGGATTIKGNITQAAAGTLDLGTSTLTLNGIGALGNYTQAAATTLNTTILNATTAGNINASAAGTGKMTTLAASALNINVGSAYIPNNTTWTILDGKTGATGVVAPTTITTNSSVLTFTAAAANGGDDLTITASRGTNGYPARASNSNAAAAGAALEAAGNAGATGDMATVLGTLDGLSASQVSAALNTVVPEVDAGVINTSTTVLNNFVGVAMDRVEQTLKVAKAADSATTGLSAGEASKISGAWGKGYGSYLTQGTRNGIAGYEAWNAGTALGADHLFADLVTVGVSGGYAYGNVDSDVNNASTYINSAQTTVYGGYEDKNLPFFIDAAGSFAWNWYEGRRDINIGGAILRTANAAYDGQQYGAYLGGGYRFNMTKNIEFTPLLSLQYNHLQLGSYTETEAGALNLSVASQGYDQLQSGLGARIAAPIKCKWGTFTPEAHGKWFYDFIGDNMAVTSNFNGGGGNFGSNGAKPALNSFNAGGQLTFNFKNDISLIANCDTEMKDEFFGIYGSATVRYNF
ncbi:MAG: autotransporter domain-containing protein, partial [Candidatus Omnitrophica bacterium]|nr:autotransporter domain-containing protein [Candidatus Omnitrophota bacterium]